MNAQAFSEWLASLSLSERISALTLIYSNLTVGTREVFLPEWAGKEKRVVDILHGVNEVHHTLSNQLVQYVTDGKYAYSIEGFSQMLLEIVNQYRMGGFLESAIEFARIRIRPLKI
jgi:hypothetical protein